MNIFTKQIQRVRRGGLLTIAAGLIMSLVMGSLPMSATAATTMNGVYNGPGTVSAHNNFESWLGSPVQYATDYVAYTNGWANDFNPDLWLTQPWGNWVKAQPGRRLVLGLPMLENSNYGQFSQGASGAFDSYFIRLSNAMVANGLGNSIIRLGYEANCDTIGPWQATDNPSGYVSLFRHIVQVMRATSGSSYQFDWTLCNGWQSGHVLDSFASFYPGDDVVDIIGMDQYDVKWQDTSVSAQQRWSYNVSRYMGLQDHKAFAAAHGKPVSFPEWGLYKPGDNFAGGGDDPYFIDAMADWMGSSDTVYQSYFNLNWGGGVLSDFPLGQAEYKARFGSTASTSPSPTPAPAPAPSPSPAPIDNLAPSVAISSPTATTTSSKSVTIAASATDNVGVKKMEIYINGSLVKSASSASISYGWGPKKSGNYSIVVKAYDAAGNVGQKSLTITKL